MQIKRIFSFVIATIIMMSCVVTSPFSVVAADENYGYKSEGSNGSIFLYFGKDSITTSGKGEIVSSVVNSVTLSRPDNLKTDSNNLVVLTLPSVDLNGKDFNKVELWAATKSVANVNVKIGDTQVATFSNVETGAWDNYTAFTADLTTTAVSGNVTLNISADAAGSYCGNYAYLKIYKDGVNDEIVGPFAGGGNVSDEEEATGLLPYQNTKRSFEERAADLVSRMTLEEKANQLGYNASAIARLGVGKYRYWREALHGVARQGKATSFPSSLSMSNTWDPDLLYRAADITSTEARAKTGTADNAFDLSYWSPTINMARDPRWGRNEECYGEDPFLTAECGIAFVDGMQGNDEKYLKSIATLKHFIANNCEGERRTGSSVMDEQTLRDYYARAFQDVVEEANAGSVMSSYNATTVTRNGEILYDYIASSGNGYTLTDLLRRTWGFEGYVVGDCGALNLLNSTKAYKRTLFPDVEDLDEVPQSATIPFGIKAGNDLDCGSGGNAYQANIVEAVNKGYMTEDDIDICVYRCILMRMRTGEFDSGATYQDLKNNASLLETDVNVAVAEEAAEKSWVLLENDGVLPIKNDVKKIALVGSMADQAYLGGYSGEPEKTVSPYQGLVNIVKEKGLDTEINFLGKVADDANLFTLKSLKLLDKNGAVKVNVDLSKATVSGATLSGSEVTGVTPKASIVVKDVNFKDVASVQAEITPSANCPSGSIVVNYDSGNQPVGSALFNGSISTISGEYTGATGGYTSTADLYLNVTINAEFSMEAYKTQLDEADLILAYGSTTLDDSDESRDRKSIALPAHEAHVGEVTAAYPDKTIVILQAAGQIDVSPYEGKSKAILWNCYNGQTQGTALAKILFGDVNPSGKLTTTWYDPADLNGTLTLNAPQQKVDAKDPGIKWIRNDYSIRQRDTKPANFPEEFSDKFVGRTYQYYKGNPVYPFGYGLSYTNFEYSNLKVNESTVDVNGKFTASVDVTNKGDVAGSEVVQLYVKSPNGDGINLPLKQLKGFDRVDLAAGETKTVSIEVDIKDLHFYDEKTLATYVPTGEYTIMVGGDSKAAENNKVALNITGTLKKELKNVAVVPSGIDLIGTVYSDGTHAQAVKTIDPKLSAVMSDESAVDLSKAEVKYTSSDEKVAVVENGVVRANTKAGVALITASVTIDGVTKETVFPVTSIVKNAITDEQRTAYKKSLDDTYNGFDKTKYSDENWTLITETYNAALKRVEEEFDNDVLKADVDAALAKMKSIKVKPADGTEIYEVTNISDTLYNEVEVEVQYNGDAYVPSGTLIATVIDEDGKIIRSSETVLGNSGKYTINDKFTGDEKIEIHIWNSFEKMMPYSKKYEHTYIAQELPSYVVYNFSNSEFDDYIDSTAGEVLPSVRGLEGWGEFGKDSALVGSYVHTKLDGSTDTLNFSRYLQQKGAPQSDTSRTLCFEPYPGYSKCKVTVLLQHKSDGRTAMISQKGDDGKLKELAQGTTSGGQIIPITAEITDMTKPIYITGKGANKNLCAIIVEYTK